MTGCDAETTREKCKRARERERAKGDEKHVEMVSYFCVEWKFQIYRLIAFARFSMCFIGNAYRVKCTLWLIQIRSKGLRVSQKNWLLVASRIQSTIVVVVVVVAVGSLPHWFFPLLLHLVLLLASPLVMEFILEHFLHPISFPWLPLSARALPKNRRPKWKAKLVTSSDCIHIVG